MEVVAFVGPSGTGKSHRAIGVAHNNNCDAIIDDGLLIKGTKILAGTSAKRNQQNTGCKKGNFYGRQPCRRSAQCSGFRRHPPFIDTGYF